MRCCVSIILIWVFGLTGVCAEDEGAAIRLSGPKVTKLDWNTRSIVSGDMNDDGLNDLIVVNNDESKIDILLQQRPGQERKPLHRSVHRDRWEPVLEDAHFYKESLVSGIAMYAVMVGDLNDDGLMDVVYTGKTEPLTFRYQLSEGGFEEASVYEDFSPASWTSTLAVKDLDGDGKQDLVALGQDEMLVFYQSDDGLSDEPLHLPLSSQVAYGLMLVDANEDGILDIFYLENSKNYPLRVRFQDEERSFSPEYSLPLSLGADLVYPFSHGDDAPVSFVFIQEQSRLLEISSMTKEKVDSQALAQPQIYNLRTSDGSPAVYAMGDLTSDGQNEILVADSKASSLFVYPELEPGLYGEPQTYPTLAHISEMVVGGFDGSGTNSMVVLSKRENILGYTYFDNDRLQFPQPIDLEGKPMAITQVDVGDDGRSEVAVVIKEGKKYFLDVLTYNDDEQHFSQTQRVSLGKVVRAPSALKTVDLDGDDQEDIVMIIPREAARIFRQTDEGSFEESAIYSSIRKSMLNDLKPSDVGLGDTNHDGIDELLVMGEGYARSISLNAEGKLEIIDQYNADRSEDKVLAPLVLDVDDDGEEEILFYDTSHEAIQILKKADDGVIRYSHAVDVGYIKPIASHIVYDKKKPTHILLFGDDRFWSIPLQGEVWALETVAEYETDLKEVIYNMIEVGDLNHDGRDDVVVLDGESHVLEVLTWSPDEHWKSRMHFTVFDENLHYGGRKGAALEPREMLVSDLTGDGLDDIVLLVHDRVLVYPQEP